MRALDPDGPNQRERPPVTRSQICLATVTVLSSLVSPSASRLKRCRASVMAAVDGILTNQGKSTAITLRAGCRITAIS